MEIIMINDSKLKIMLREEDLRQFEISADELDYSNTETKRMFWDILCRAKHKTGFNTDGQRVLVQLYPSKDGGCEMFVTKMGSLGESDDEHKCTHSTGYEKLCSQLKKQKKNHLSKGILGVYGFDKTEWLIRVCRKLSSLGYIGDSSAYKCDNGRSYLFLTDVDTSPAMPLDEFSFITEYGTPESSDMLKYYIGEHGKVLCESNAVSVLGKF